MASVLLIHDTLHISCIDESGVLTVVHCVPGSFAISLGIVTYHLIQPSTHWYAFDPVDEVAVAGFQVGSTYAVNAEVVDRALDMLTSPCLCLLSDCCFVRFSLG